MRVLSKALWLAFVLIPVSGLLSGCGGGGGSGGGASSSSAAQIFHALGTQVVGNGDITPAQADVRAGTTQTFTLIPEAGFEVASTSGCAGSLNGQVYVTNAITAPCTLTVTFALIEYSLAGNVSGLVGSLGLSLMVDDVQESLTITTNGNFTFARAFDEGEGYQVAITAQPNAQTCQIANDFGLFDNADISNIQITCTATGATASVSGTIAAAAGISIDSSINDILAFYADNSSPLTPQSISNRVTLHGFASAEATGGNSLDERYASTFDEDDYYQVSLQAGQVIQLQVVDFDGFNVGTTFEGDLDLYLFDSNGEVAGRSDGITEYEEVVVPEDGDYLVNVWAFSGISKYVLRILPPGDGSFGAALSHASAADFVPHQMVVQMEDSLGDLQTLQAQTNALMRFGHTQSDRPTLVTMESQVVEFALAKGQKAKARVSRGLDDLRQLNAVGYDQLVTLRNIKAMSQQPGVRYAEPNYRRSILRVPNDPGYPSQWHYNAISLPQAWDISIGDRPSGQEVIVAVIDTGVYLAHPDFDGQLVAGYDFIFNPDSAVDGDGIDANADDPGDSDQRGQSSWHGTHVAATIAAASDDNSGVAGVAWGAQIMPIRVLGKNGGTSYDVMQGVRFAAGLSNDSGTVPARRADIANLSLGGGGGSLAEQNAYLAARATGMIIVAAAGNDNTSAPSYPAAYDGVISVSATDFANGRAPYSNFGSTIMLAAPGGNTAVDLNGDGYADGVLSAVADDTSGDRQPAYRFYQGTSMAAPHVAGVLALMKAVHPALDPDDVDMLIQTGAIVDDLGVNGRDDFYGFGMINALKAVRVASDLSSGTPLPEWPPQMRVSPATLNIGLFATASVTLSNEGGGDPEVSGVAANRPWLSVTADNVSGNGVGTYQISVNRNGLEPGFYQGQVTFDFTDLDVESLTLAVNMQVGDVSSEGELTQLYVLLLDPETQESIAQVLPKREGDTLTYSFPDVPPGEYTVIAGSDIDVDLFICQSGESCGIYPSLAQRQVVEVKGVDLSGIDFVADILGNFSSINTSATQVKDAPSGIARMPIVHQPTNDGVARQK